jgi:hypothetical protein
MRRSRWRVGRCEFSQRLLRERLWRCSTPGQDFPFGRAVALELIRNDDPRHVLQALEQLAEKLLRRLLVAAALHQDIEHVIVLVDSAPQVMALAIDGQKDLVEVPLVPWLGASTLQLIRVVLPKLQTPLADGWVCPTFYTLGSSAS